MAWASINDTSRSLFAKYSNFLLLFHDQSFQSIMNIVFIFLYRVTRFAVFDVLLLEWPLAFVFFPFFSCCRHLLFHNIWWLFLLQINYYFIQLIIFISNFFYIALIPKRSLLFIWVSLCEIRYTVDVLSIKLHHTQRLESLTRSERGIRDSSIRMSRQMF